MDADIKLKLDRAITIQNLELFKDIFTKNCSSSDGDFDIYLCKALEIPKTLDGNSNYNDKISLLSYLYSDKEDISKYIDKYMLLTADANELANLFYYFDGKFSKKIAIEMIKNKHVVMICHRISGIKSVNLVDCIDEIHNALLECEFNPIAVKWLTPYVIDLYSRTGFDKYITPILRKIIELNHNDDSIKKLKPIIKEFGQDHLLAFL